MILGTGIDLIEVARIASSFERFGERFVNRVLLPNEIAYCLSHKNPAPFLAAQFAAKEAISKAFGTGIGGAPPTTHFVARVVELAPNPFHVSIWGGGATTPT